MTKPQKYILNEVKVIEKECLEKGISPREWIERYAEEYRGKLGIADTEKVGVLKQKEGVRQ